MKPYSRIAKNVLNRLQQEIIAHTPLTPADRAVLLDVSNGRTDVIAELTDNELDVLITEYEKAHPEVVKHPNS